MCKSLFTYQYRLIEFRLSLRSRLSNPRPTGSIFYSCRSKPRKTNHASKYRSYIYGGHMHVLMNRLYGSMAESGSNQRFRMTGGYVTSCATDITLNSSVIEFFLQVYTF